eukprot:CAMPEP_0196758684 /NCGR_PEP_ID=MMETSP1091-20130531/104315_1 /TAXON_ID=302021 /ORGANISM="Rhodomonas sp., Strain CCMP768" /LENGTH=251 /DNA_ID=CAMNT_0042107515 /DNA_START=48 /DNA_END=803 /DNA_ORIENTATION=-
MGALFSSIWRKREGRILVLGLDGAGKTTLLYRLKLDEAIHTIPTFGFNVEAVTRENFELIIWDIGGQDKIRPLWRHYYLNTHAVIFVIDSADTARFPQAREILHEICSAEDLGDAPVLVLANKQDLPAAATVRAEASSVAEDLGDAPVLVLANKQDLPAAVTVRAEASSVGLLELVPESEWRLESDNDFEDVSLVVLDPTEEEALSELQRNVTDALELDALPLDRVVHVQGVSAVTGEGVEDGIRWLESRL